VGATQSSRQSPERIRESGRSAGVQPINSALVAGLDDVVLSWRHKAAPAAAHGQAAAAFIGSGPHLSDFQTPLLTLDAAAMTANMDRLAQWCADKGVLLAPHGKTTMAPQLWRDQLKRGAWGITLANSAQLRVAHAFGVGRVQLANSLTDPRAIMWLAAEQGPDFAVVSWVDSLQTVELLQQALEATGTVLDVLVELGGAGGRTGARSVEAVVEIARAVSAATHLRLVGVAGYEGSLAHTADADGLAAVRGYLFRLKETHRILLAEGLYAADADVIVTAGGSAYFDDVVDVLADCIDSGGAGSQRVDVIIRSGAYVVHDDGFYRTISPFSRRGNQPFRSAMHGWARVVSQPEPGLALLDAGKRDLPVDEGLPEPQALGQILGGELEPLVGASITAVNDQHSYLRFDPATTTVNIGDVVRLGLSHPCTAFDKWTLIPVLADTHADQRVAGLIHTFF